MKSIVFNVVLDVYGLSMKMTQSSSWSQAMAQGVGQLFQSTYFRIMPFLIGQGNSVENDGIII